MLAMVAALNSKTLPAATGLPDAKVTCFTCHRGSTKPATEMPPARRAGPAAAGRDSAEAVARASQPPILSASARSARGFAMTDAMLDFDLGEMADTIRETTRRFARDKIDPIAAEIDAKDEFPRHLWPQMGELGPPWHHRRGGGWRPWSRLSRACRRAGGSRAGVGVGRPELRRAFEPLHQPGPPLGEPRAEAQISAQADQRRACRRAGDERSGRGQRRRRHEAQGRARAATAIASTAPNSGSPTAPKPTRSSSTPRPARVAAASPLS